MKIHKSRGLSRDKSRCWGLHCQDKEECLRYLQTKQDEGKEYISYIATMMDNSGYCQMKIEVE